MRYWRDWELTSSEAAVRADWIAVLRGGVREKSRGVGREDVWAPA
jgi:hypothetical protein